jgi:CRISPR/Cas system-associated exonuclease Cas4 (RecB family)
VARNDPFRTPSEIAEFVYCPRALHYRRTRAPPDDDPRLSAGVRFHARELAGERRRAEHALLLWTVLVVAGAVAALGVLAGLGAIRP